MNPDTCICADSVEFMRTHLQNNGSPFAHLVIADPPFNIGFKYVDYDDKLPPGKFLEWNEEWLGLCIKCMTQYGTMLLCMGDEYISEVDIMCRKLGLTRQNWMIWHYGFGQSGPLATRKRYVRSKTHILRLTKDPRKFTFNAAAVAVPSDRFIKYNDRRANPKGKCPNDVFIHKRIAGSHRVRVRGITTQMPVSLVSSWVLAMSNPGELVFDPFAGSGASLIAAQHCGRHYFGCEISKMAHKVIIDRLKTQTIEPHNNT